MGQNFFDIRTLNCRSLTTSDLNLCRKKLKSFLQLNPSLCILVEVNQNFWGIKQLAKHFRYELRNYRIHLHENVIIQRRGIIILINKSCPLKLTHKEPVDVNCIKLSMKYEDKSFGLFCTYAPSNGLDTEFLLKVRRYQLNSTEDHKAIIGDLNCTLDRRMDKLGYARYHHWKCREIIH